MPANATESLKRAAKPPFQALLQSMLLQKLVWLKTFTADQAMQLDAWNTNLQHAAALLIMRFALYRAQFEQLSTQPAKRLRQAQRTHEQIIPEKLGDGLSQQIQPKPLTRRNPDSLRPAVGIALNLWLDALEQVNLVVNLEQWQLVGTDLAEHSQHLLDLLIALGLVGVDHVQQEVGVARLLQRGTKGLDQLVRQMADEAHGIGKHDRTDIADFNASQRRVERGEQLVGRVDLRFGQRIE